MQYWAESASSVTLLTFRPRGGDTVLVLDLTVATVVTGEVGFNADLSALGCFSLSCAGRFFFLAREVSS